MDLVPSPSGVETTCGLPTGLRAGRWERGKEDVSFLFLFSSFSFTCLNDLLFLIYSGLVRELEVNGIDGILSSYEATLKRMTPAEPRRFAQVIAQASRLASEYHKSLEHKYFVLVVLTNGVSDDINQVVSEIIRASSLPLSVLFVGVGDADFGPLKAALNIQGSTCSGLGGSNSSSTPARSVLRTARTIAARDMVQFVATRDLPLSPKGGLSSCDKEALAKILLQDLPRQVCSYFACHKIQPHPPRRMAVKEHRSSSLASSLSLSSGM